MSATTCLTRYYLLNRNGNHGLVSTATHPYKIIKHSRGVPLLCNIYYYHRQVLHRRALPCKIFFVAVEIIHNAQPAKCSIKISSNNTYQQSSQKHRLLNRNTSTYPRSQPLMCLCVHFRLEADLH